MASWRSGTVSTWPSDGEGTQYEALRALVEQLGLGAHVWLSDGFVPIEELLDAIASADAGVVAIRRDVFRDLTQANKMYEFIAMRKPVIISRTRSVTEYFDESAFRMFESGDVEDLARAILELARDPQLRRELPTRAAQAAEPYRWPFQKTRYRSVVERLLRRGE
jgi:glycosyltransferase involved in cell wall biosynthesis